MQLGRRPCCISCIRYTLGAVAYSSGQTPPQLNLCGGGLAFLVMGWPWWPTTAPLQLHLVGQSSTGSTVLVWRRPPCIPSLRPWRGCCRAEATATTVPMLPPPRLAGVPLMGMPPVAPQGLPPIAATMTVAIAAADSTHGRTPPAVDVVLPPRPRQRPPAGLLPSRRWWVVGARRRRR